MNIVLVGKRGSKIASKIAENNNCDFIEYDLQEFADGSSQAILNSIPRDNKVLLFYEFSKPMDIHGIRVLRLINLLKKYGNEVILIAPFMPFIREKDEGNTDSWFLFEDIKIITIDAHVNRVNLISLQPEFFATQISKNDLIIIPDTGALRYITNGLLYGKHEDIEYVVAKKDRLHGVRFLATDVQKIKNRNCVILDDIVDSGYTLRSTIEIIRANGAKKIDACITHNLNETIDYIAWGLDSLSICGTLLQEGNYTKIFDPSDLLLDLDRFF